REFVRPGTLSHVVHGADLVVIRHPVREASVRIRELVADRRDQCFAAAGRSSVDLVVRDRRTTVRSGCLPGQGDLGIATGGREVLWRDWTRGGVGWGASD